MSLSIAATQTVTTEDELTQPSVTWVKFK